MVMERKGSRRHQKTGFLGLFRKKLKNKKQWKADCDWKVSGEKDGIVYYAVIDFRLKEKSGLLFDENGVAYHKARFEADTGFDAIDGEDHRTFDRELVGNTCLASGMMNRCSQLLEDTYTVMPKKGAKTWREFLVYFNRNKRRICDEVNEIVSEAEYAGDVYGKKKQSKDKIINEIARKTFEPIEPSTLDRFDVFKAWYTEKLRGLDYANMANRVEWKEEGKIRALVVRELEEHGFVRTKEEKR